MSRRSRARAEWVKRVADWVRSGLSAKDFAKRIGVNHRTLSDWKYRLARDKRAASRAVAKHRPSGTGEVSSRPAFIEVAATTIGGGESIEIAMGSGEVVRVPVGFDRATLVGVLDVLGSRR